MSGRTSRGRVVTWNVWWRFGPAWRDRQPALLLCLRDADSDVVALQECWGAGTTSQAHEFARELGLHAAFVAPSLPPAPDPPETADQVGVEVGIGLLSRWPILDVQAVPLPAPGAGSGRGSRRAGAPRRTAPRRRGPPGVGAHRRQDRAGRAVVDLATDAATEGPLPVVLSGGVSCDVTWTSIT